MQLAEHYPPSAADSSWAATELGVLLSKLVALRTELADLAFDLECRGRVDAADLATVISVHLRELGGDGAAWVDGGGARSPPRAPRSACSERSPIAMKPTSTDGPTGRSFTRHLPAVARILMGLPFVVFGLNGFLNFIPPPPTPLPAGAAAFAGALVASGYMMPLIGATQLLVGVLLVVNRYVPLALILIAPFLVNAVAFHVFLEPSGLVMVAIFAALEAYLAWAYRRAYAPLSVSRAAPN